MQEPSEHFPRRLGARVIELMSKGSFPDTACAEVGVSVPELNYWLRRGENEPEGELRNFYRKFTRAVARCENLLLERVLSGQENITPTQWRVYVWFLERRFPNHWGGIKVVLSEEVDEGARRGTVAEKLQGRLDSFAAERDAGADAGDLSAGGTGGAAGGLAAVGADGATAAGG